MRNVMYHQLVFLAEDRAANQIFIHIHMGMEEDVEVDRKTLSLLVLQWSIMPK